MSYNTSGQDGVYLIPALSYGEELLEMKRAKGEKSQTEGKPRLTPQYLQPWTQQPTQQPADPAAWHEGWADRINYRNSLNRAIPKDIEWRGLDSGSAVVSGPGTRAHAQAHAHAHAHSHAHSHSHAGNH
eukprot:TRINITY_DN9540_c0_g1_i4.p1 TRINITY_DN9540_c0_g1~~TRINITY_DN9540_c0_g1_i4.p1  ORF type:complete len:129 (+),score=24.43 TRINITY_DN9540_c0_g1_i4:87-473(+)